MQEFDILLDTEPTAESCAGMVAADIRNRQADDELLYFQEHKKFLYVHPFTIQRRQEQDTLSELRRLQQENPEQFMTEITNITQNIRRIESNIRTKKYKNEAELEGWQKNLEAAKLRKKIISAIISGNTD